MNVKIIDYPNIVTNYPDLKAEGKDIYVNTDFQRYLFEIDKKSYDIIIPNNYMYDGASVPKLFRNIVNIDGKKRVAVLLHDWIYANNGAVGKYKLTRKQADILLYELLKECGAEKPWLTYKAVRMNILTTWGKNEPKFKE